MAKEEIKTKTNIGSSSLILIFIVLCLSTFGLLSLTSAKGDWNLAHKNADAVQEYYRAVREGNEFLNMADQLLIRAWSKGGYQEVEKVLEKDLKPYYNTEEEIIGTDIAMERGQALRIELELVRDAAVRYRIRAWKVYNQIDYDIDDSMPVWDGT